MLFLSIAIAVSIRSLAQTTVAAVPLNQEPHHHLVYSSAKMRIFNVAIPPNGTTLVHQHDADYLWVGLGDAKIVNLPVGKPSVHLLSKDAALHFAPGGFAHKAHNEGETIYSNATIELLQKQTRPRNLCEPVLVMEPTHCVQATPDFLTERAGITVQSEFETDQMRFDLLRIESGKSLRITGLKNPPLFIALEGTQASAIARGMAAQILTSGKVLACQPGMKVEIRNTGKTRARFLVFEFNQPRL